jgi:hypothetical protein
MLIRSIRLGRLSQLGFISVAVLLSSACQEPPPERKPGTFSFAVLGDVPYGPVEEIRFRRAIRQLDAADLALIIHVGDILWYPCSDELFQNRLATFQRQRHPLVYTTANNEWADCHEEIAGTYQPLERLQRLREIFFADPTTSLGASAIPLTVQAADTAWAEFIENARWTWEGFVFFTVHLVGEGNGLTDFPGRTASDNTEAARRTAAAAAWLRSSFAYADSVHALGVVIGMHAAPGFLAAVDDDYRQAYEPFLESLKRKSRGSGLPCYSCMGMITSSSSTTRWCGARPAKRSATSPAWRCSAPPRWDG